MKRKYLFGAAICLACMSMAQVQSDSLQQAPIPQDTLSTVQADSVVVLVAADSVAVTATTPDSTMIALRPLTTKVDSTAIIMEKV